MEPWAPVGIGHFACMPHLKLTRAASTEPQRPSHDHKAVWAFAGAAAWERKRKIHFPRAVSNGVDDHSAAVKTWLHKFIIGKNFCPWAKSASDNGGVRVVTSLATTEDGILCDLEEEVAALPSSPNVPQGVPSTTLLVCPHVPSWQDFDAFNEFYGNALQNGVLFEENFKVKLVAFHPSFIHSPLYGPVLEVGDMLTLPTPEGEVVATVLDADVEADGDEAFRVHLENGEEQVISYARLAELLQDSQCETVEDADEDGEDAETEMDEQMEILENMAQRAPRPTFHLLRLCDDPLLQRVAAGGRSYSFRTGLMSLIDALEEQLLNPAPGTSAAEIRRNSAIDRLQSPEDGTKAQVLLRDGSRVEADCVIAAIPPTVLGGLLKSSGLDISVSNGQSLCQLLEEIKNKSVAVVHISYDKDVLKERRLRGAGYFVGSSEKHDRAFNLWKRGRWVLHHSLAMAISVVVGSRSAPKLEAARQGFGRLGLAMSVAVTGVEAESGVSAQPFGMEETRLGALNRLKAARASAEGAVADFCIAFEGGVEEDAEGMMACFAVVCVQFRDDDFISQVRSATHSVPPGITKMLREGIELGVATDRFFADRCGTVGDHLRGSRIWQTHRRHHRSFELWGCGPGGILFAACVLELSTFPER
eukprot:s923_g29.t1